jgi:hypothetical protein
MSVLELSFSTMPYVRDLVVGRVGALIDTHDREREALRAELVRIRS